MGENKSTSSGADIIMKGSFSVVVKTAFATTVENTKAALKDNGFGVLTEIDFQKTFDAKLGEKILPSLQLGACNPKLAWQVYSDNEDYAVLLPCPVVVQAQADGTTKVSSIEPRPCLERSWTSKSQR